MLLRELFSNTNTHTKNEITEDGDLSSDNNHHKSYDLIENLTTAELEQELDNMLSDLNLKEGKLRKGARKAIPDLETWPQLDNNNSPYATYRFGVALAGAPNFDMDKSGPVGGKLVTIAYTDADQEILDHAAKVMGVKSRDKTTSKSEEMPNVNKVSPIAKPKRNRYGV